MKGGHPYGWCFVLSGRPADEHTVCWLMRSGRLAVRQVGELGANQGSPAVTFPIWQHSFISEPLSLSSCSRHGSALRSADSALATGSGRF